MIKPDKQDRSVTLNGLDYIDVPALGRKDYKLNFYTYKEGSFSAKVITLAVCTDYALMLIMCTGYIS